MKLKDFNRLVKFMELTTSPSDNEALTAIRKANQLLVENNVDWKKVFNRLVTLEVEDTYAADVEPAPAAPRRPQEDAAKTERAARIDKAFQRTLDATPPSPNAPNGGFRGFLLSLQAQWQEKGRLSEAQLEALFRAEAKVLREAK